MCYVLAPAVIVVFNRDVRYGDALVAATVAVGLYFWLVALDPATTLASHWRTYFNPFNNLLLYTHWCGALLQHTPARTGQVNHVRANARVRGYSVLVSY